MFTHEKVYNQESWVDKCKRWNIQVLLITGSLTAKPIVELREATARPVMSISFGII